MVLLFGKKTSLISDFATLNACTFAQKSNRFDFREKTIRFVGYSVISDVVVI